MPVTVAGCHGPTGGTSLTALVALIPLLDPRIAAVVVAAHLPEAGVVVVEHANAGDELGALPEVEVRDEQARRTAVVTRQRLAVGRERDPCLAAGHVVERKVRRVPGGRVGDDVGRRRQRWR